VPKGSAEHPDRTAFGDGEPAAGDACRRADRASSAERFYRSLSDEQKARFNAIAPTDDANAAGKDQRDLANFCDEKSPSVTDLPIDRIGQAVQPKPTQRAALGT
jgi:hypothetical protein